MGNAKTFAFMGQFYDFPLDGRTVTVKEGDTLSLGGHTLHFHMTPMVHWPEVMMTYESSEKLLLRRRFRLLLAPRAAICLTTS